MKGKTVAHRLSELVAFKTGKGHKRKAARKAAKKAIIGRTSKKWRAARNKKKNDQRKHRQAELKQQEQVVAESHELVGKVVRCIAADASKCWQNAQCRVMAVVPKTGMAEVALCSTGTKRQSPPGDYVDWEL